MFIMTLWMKIGMGIAWPLLWLWLFGNLICEVIVQSIKHGIWDIIGDFKDIWATQMIYTKWAAMLFAVPLNDVVCQETWLEVLEEMLLEEEA